MNRNNMLEVIKNKDIIKSLAKSIWNDILIYVKKGYLTKKIMKRQCRFLGLKSNIESWDIMRQRKTEVLLNINDQLLKDSNLVLVDMVFDWEIQNDIVYHTLEFNLKVKEQKKEEPVSPLPQQQQQQQPQQQQQQKQQLGVPRPPLSDSGSTSRFKVSTSEK
jgi:hypothetical protein